MIDAIERGGKTHGEFTEGAVPESMLEQLAGTIETVATRLFTHVKALPADGDDGETNRTSVPKVAKAFEEVSLVFPFCIVAA